MRTVRIWTLESNYDAKAVRCLAHKLVSYLQLGNLAIQTVWRHPKGGDALRRATQNFLKQDACVIFVIDKDGPMSDSQRRREPNSLINQIESVVRDNRFVGKAFLAQAVPELEAWLLIDCLGIFCYFARKRARYRENCRDKVSTNQSFKQLVKRSQKSDTENILDTGTGNSGAKEYLTAFTEKILLELNPNMPQRNVHRERFREAMSPKVAEHVVIDGQTLQRNNSLRALGDVLAQFN